MVIKYQEKPVKADKKEIGFHYVEAEAIKANHGVECLFIDLGEGIGLKLYDSKNEALRARQIQYVLSVLDMAPSVYSVVLEFPITDYMRNNGPAMWYYYDSDDTLYGYYTEVVTPLDRYMYREPITNRKKRELNYKCHEYFHCDMFDEHEGNLGYKGNELVFIDFGGHSFLGEDFDELYKYYGV